MVIEVFEELGKIVAFIFMGSTSPRRASHSERGRIFLISRFLKKEATSSSEMSVTL
jgi:hypothetical protein